MFVTCHVNFMLNMKLTISDQLSVKQKSMHKLKLTGQNQLEVYTCSYGMNKSFSILNGFSVLQILLVRKIINDGVKASTRESQARFQIILVFCSASLA